MRALSCGKGGKTVSGREQDKEVGINPDFGKAENGKPVSKSRRVFMVTGIASGYIDERIRFCPYCGQRLYGVALFSQTVCEACGEAFFVIGAERQSAEEFCSQMHGKGRKHEN